jgi:hypothetical protein
MHWPRRVIPSETGFHIMQQQQQFGGLKPGRDGGHGIDVGRLGSIRPGGGLVER